MYSAEEFCSRASVGAGAAGELFRPSTRATKRRAATLFKLSGLGKRNFGSCICRWVFLGPSIKLFGRFRRAVGWVGASAALLVLLISLGQQTLVGAIPQESVKQPSQGCRKTCPTPFLRPFIDSEDLLGLGPSASHMYLQVSFDIDV